MIGWSMKNWMWFSIIFVFSACSTGGIVSKSDQSASKASPREEKTTNTSQPEDFLDQFSVEYQRLTIPYLRKQDFPGSQIAIVETIQENSSYSSYIASYLSEDLTQYGLLTRPKTQMPAGGYPAVVFIHGYIPPLEYQTTEKYQAYVHALASQGIVVYKIDLRGHGNSQGEPNGAYYSSDYIYDTLNAYASLQKLDYVDSEKVGLWGHSMAGNIVARTMAIKTDIPLGIIWSGAVYSYTDMAKYRIQDSSYEPSQNPNRGKRQQLYEMVGEVSEDNQFWQAVAPINFLKDITGKLHIHHATSDPVVNIGYSRDLAAALEDAGVSYQLFEYSSGGHNLESPAFSAAMERTISAYKQM